jgi:hypothetical protein
VQCLLEGAEDLGSQSDKENQKKLVPETQKRRISCSPLSRSSPLGAILHPSTQVQPIALQATAPSFLNTAMAPSLLNMTMASSSRTLVASARGPLHLQPINNGVTNQQLSVLVSVQCSILIPYTELDHLPAR